MKKWCFFVFFVVLSSSLWGKPAQVIILRHGEKMKGTGYLSLKGKVRSAALAPYIVGTPFLLLFGLPVAIYATKVVEEDRSYRTQATMDPLAQLLQIPIKQPFNHKEVTSLAKEILSFPGYEGKMVIVCWHHHYIPQLATALGVSAELPCWNNEVFDRLWILTFLSDGKVDFQNLPQRLLFGDSAS